MMPSATAAPVFVRGYQPGCIGRIVELHGTYYSNHWGVGAEVETLAAVELSEFCQQYNPQRDLLLTAWIDDKLIGSIAIHSSNHAGYTARLRWFILDTAYQGQGVGRALLERSLKFCQEKSFRSVYLWTVEELPQSRHLYESVGFRVVERQTDARYGTSLVNLRMELDLTSTGLS